MLSLLEADFWTQTALSLGLAILVGMFANDLKRWTLFRRAILEVAVVTGDGIDAAERRFWDQRPQLARGPRPVTVVIVDYGSGNLRSAAKAFERAVAESGLDRYDQGQQRSSRGRRARAYRAAGRRRLRRLPARARALPG